MGDLSPHFDRSEFECSCGCGGDTIDSATLEAVEAIRQYYGVPVRVNSAYRCLMYNAEIGSNDASQHPKGRAVDIEVEGISPDEVADYADTVLNLGGIGRYNTFTHIDTRGGRARW